LGRLLLVSGRVSYVVVEDCLVKRRHNFFLKRARTYLYLVKWCIFQVICKEGTYDISGWWFQIFFIFTLIPGEMIQFDEHIFQMGWFNHQLDIKP